MTLSAIDNPYGLIGADSMDADKGAKNSAFSTNSDLFSQLLSTTGVKQVAYRGSNDEFDETLKMQDETVAHEARMGEDRRKYDGLGLNQGDAAKIESTRSPREIEGQKPVASDSDAADFLPQHGANGNGKDASDGSETSVDNSAKLLALGAQPKVSSVDETRSANAAEARRAADAQLLRPDQQSARTADASSQARSAETLTLKVLPKSRYATSQPQTSNATNAANQQKTVIKVTQLQEDMVSQPTSTLAAGVALAAQAEKPAKPTAQTLSAPAEDLDGDDRPPLANSGSLGRPERPQSAKSQHPSQPQTPLAGLTPTPSQTPSPLPNQASQQAQIAMAAASRPDASVQPNQTLADPLASSPSTNNNSQQTQRSGQPQAPRPARPPVPPQEVTNQVAVQIKKAIGQGNDQIRIQLKPAELGRVEVKLEVSENGRAVAVVSAERPETLDLLQRDAAGLRQALQDAGLSTDSKSLSFNLHGEGSKFEKEMAERGHASRNSDENAADAGDSDEPNAEEAVLLAAEAAASDGRVNVQV